MEDRSRVAPATGKDIGTCFVALELSGSRWVAALHAPGLGDKISLHTLSSGDVPGLLERIGRVSAKLRRTGFGAVRVTSCYEAGRDGFWLHRVLVAQDIDNHVIDPASVAVDRRARRAKTDRIDARALLRTLMAQTRGERACSVVRVPTAAAEDAKRPHRERLIGERGQHVNRIQALCATQGITGFRPLRGDRLARLEELRTATGMPLPVHLKQEITRELKRLELVLAQIAEIEAARDAALAAPPAAGAAAPAAADAATIRLLVRLRGIGPTLGTVLAREVFYRDFRNRRAVAGYVGLAGSPFNSGGMTREQGISKAGNPRARTAMIELAWLWLRWQPDSALSRWFRRRLNGATGRLKRVLIVALARKLLVALWRYQQSGVVPSGAILTP